MDSRDAYGEWRRLSETAEDGCLLVRPDGHVAWRRLSTPATAAEAFDGLVKALRTLLDR